MRVVRNGVIAMQHCRLKYTGIWCCVGQVVPNILKDHCAFICSVQPSKNNHMQSYRGADKSLAWLDWKNWTVATFRPTQRSLLLWRPGWTDNLLNFFWVACKSQSVVTVACFLPGRAKDLSAPWLHGWNHYGHRGLQANGREGASV